MDVTESEYGLTGKRAIVCGSTQGMGRSCALRLARLGAEVILVARDEAARGRVSLLRALEVLQRFRAHERAPSLRDGSEGPDAGGESTSRGAGTRSTSTGAPRGAWLGEP